MRPALPMTHFAWIKPAAILRCERAAELEKKGVKDYQLDYALKTIRRLAPAPARVAAAAKPRAR